MYKAHRITVIPPTTYERAVTLVVSPTATNGVWLDVEDTLTGETIVEVNLDEVEICALRKALKKADKRAGRV